MDYRLDGLSARTFEHLVRSLSLEAISSTSTPFGDGPDGGREAIFDGLTDYGPDSARWNGYGVIQAKFLQRTQDTRRDGLWLLRELKKEISKFTRKSRPLRAPKYYIIATNVVLSPTEGTGIKDKVLEQLRSFQEQCKLANFDFWDYDKIRVLLDSNASVRQVYFAWIAPGDVLMQLSEMLSEARPDYHKLIVNYLQKEMLTDQYAKLEQAHCGRGGETTLGQFT